MQKLIQKIFLLPIHFYKFFISGWLPGACRFTPTCSEYAVEAIKQHGVVKGVWLGVKRICRCHPWGEHTFDPVPDKK